MAIGIPRIGIRIKRARTIEHTFIPIAASDGVLPEHVTHRASKSKPATTLETDYPFSEAFNLSRQLETIALICRSVPPWVS